MAIQTILTEARETIRGLQVFLESLAYPTNPNNPSNVRLEDLFYKALGDYFGSLGRAFPYDRIGGIYDRHVKESAYTSAIDIYAPVVAMMDARLLAAIEGHMRTIYLKGAVDMMEWGKTALGKPILYEGPPWDDAINYAKDLGSKLVTQMDDETQRRLAKIVSDGIKNKRGIPGIKRDIRKQFTDMSQYRARMIAQTESNNALSEAFLDRSRALGVDGKKWIVFHPCPICEANGAAGKNSDGVIPLEGTYPSGHSRPTAHPNCKCTLAPVILDSNQKVETQINKFGERYKTSDIEHGIAFDEKGNQLLSKTGNSNSIYFSPDDMQSMRGANVFAHNHPRSISFSMEDVVFAEKIDAKSIVVTSKLNKYTMKPIGSWQIDKVRVLFEKENARLFPQAQAIFNKSGQEAADRWLFHNTWLNIKDKANYIYTKEAM